MRKFDAAIGFTQRSVGVARENVLDCVAPETAFRTERSVRTANLRQVVVEVVVLAHSQLGERKTLGAE